MKAIMYHYIRPYDQEFPFWRGLNLDDFIKQLDFFEEEFGFVSKKDFMTAIETKIPVNGVVLTFDDGFSDHYKYVFPELIKRKLWGIFYVPILPYISNKILDVHRVHLLTGKYGGKEIANSLENIINKDMLSHSHIDEFHTFQSYKKDYDNDIDYVKRLLNYFISYDHRTEVIDRLMSIYYPDDSNLMDNFYMKKNSIIEMSKAGMVIGSHTVNHPVMSKLPLSEQKYEINRSFEEIQLMTMNSKLKTFCYPYGGFHSFTHETEQMLTDAGCSFSFNVESKNIDSDYLENKIQALPRFNCNEFPYGACR
jgi:peptidoglycan/xylan/chitin deacetylase (PgdA/CDA1 family)